VYFVADIMKKFCIDLYKVISIDDYADRSGVIKNVKKHADRFSSFGRNKGCYC
jgi:hypothetical protein